MNDNLEINITGFLGGLSQYYNHENDLSNITVLMCNNCTWFRDALLRFFFPEINPEQVLYIEREVWDEKKGRSRVDIMIGMNDNTHYIIEVKIGDMNHHFGTYDSDYDVTPDRFGYILNYPIKNEGGYRIFQWKELYAHLKEKLNAEADPILNTLTEGYLYYLKSVCHITEYTTAMRFDNIQSINQFASMANDIINTYTTNEFSTRMDGLKIPVSGIRTAPYFYFPFTINYRRRNCTDFAANLFLHYPAQEGAELRIDIGVAPNASTALARRLNGIGQMKAGKTYREPKLDFDQDWYCGWQLVWFEMKQAEKFAKAATPQEQQKILSAFCHEVIDFLADNYSHA